ncbi:MAG: AraC family transcriptional regulator [Gammaproteobacteria bacterium]
MPRDSSFLRRVRAHGLAVAIVSFAACAGLLAGAQNAHAQAPGTAASTAPGASAAALAAGNTQPSQVGGSNAPAAASASAADPIPGATADPAASGSPGLIATAEPPPDTRGLDEEIQNLKKDVVDLNKDLFVLEEELLFPANTQVAVFISMDVGEFFAIDNVTLKIDQKEVANYLYTPREAEALLKGGVHRLYLGNLKVGEHELVAFFTGKGPNERDYKRGATLKFEKGIGAKYLELKINDRQKKQQPEFEIKDWE